MFKCRHKNIKNILYIVCGILFLLYLLSIFVINVKGRIWVNYDIYSDAILSKYIAESHSLFPKGWHFGNQIYVIATPILASIFYMFLHESYLSLAVASCCMTFLCVLSFVWCIKPFVKKQFIVVGLLLFIGGANISLSATTDIGGLQVFYTMASYYSCYVIGIFITLGIFLRYYYEHSINKIFLLFVLLVNFALGMQSLREMLVLNIPLCMLGILALLAAKEKAQTAIVKNTKSILFVLATFTLNLFGHFLRGWLVRLQVINQSDMLNKVTDNFIDNFCNSIYALLNYIGVMNPLNSNYCFYEFIGAIFSIMVVLSAIACIIVQYIKKSEITPMGIVVIFFVISLTAVLCSGILVIELRNIYFFCWYLLVTCAMVYFLDLRLQHRLMKSFKWLMVVGLIFISTINYYTSFVGIFKEIDNGGADYQNIVEQLKLDGIEYLYSDCRTDRNNICTASNDEIIYGTLKFSNDTEDLWDSFDYLYYDEWFTESAFNNAYIVLSSKSLTVIDNECSEEYKKELLNNLQLVHTFEIEQDVLYFYKGSEKIFDDMTR